MIHVTSIPQKDDFERCLKVVTDTIKIDGMNLTEKELEILTKDVMDTSVMIGGDYSSECIRDIVLQYIRNDFYPRFKSLHAGEIRGDK